MALWGVPTPMTGQPIIDTRLETLLRGQNDFKDGAEIFRANLARHLGTVHEDLKARNELLLDHLLRVEKDMSDRHSALRVELDQLSMQIEVASRRQSADIRETQIRVRTQAEELRNNLWGAFWHSLALSLRRQYRRARKALWHREP